MVSRLISLAGERSGLERQIASLTHSRDQTQRQADEMRAELAASFAHAELDTWIGALLDDEHLSNEELYDTMEDDGGWLLSDYEPHLEALRRTLADARLAVDALYGGHALDEVDDDDLPETADELEGFGLPVSEYRTQRRVWTAVGQRARRNEVQRRRRGREAVLDYFGVSRLSGLSRTGSPLAYTRHLARLEPSHSGGPTGEDYQQRVAEVAALDKELEVMRSALEDVKRPRRLWQGFWILAVFAAVGILYPMIWMATAPDTWNTFAAVSVVIAFALGLLALLVYIALFVKDLGQDEPRQ